jgi:hypothetical protein
VKDTRQSAEQTRRDRERELRESGADVPFPGWERLAEEALEEEPKVLLTVRDAEGRAVRRLEGSAEAGIHRVSWDLRRLPPEPVDLEPPGFQPPWNTPPRGPLAPPGSYRVEMALLSAAGVERLAEAQTFEVEPVPGSALPAPDFDAVTAFQRETGELLRRVQGAAEELQRAEERLRHLRHALLATPRAEPSLFTRLAEIEASLAGLRVRLVGDRTRSNWNEPSVPSVQRRVRQVASGHWNTRQAPTATQRESLAVASSEFSAVIAELAAVLETELPAFEAELEAAGAPWTPGRKLPIG